MAQTEYVRNFYLTTQAGESVFQGSQNHCPETKKKTCFLYNTRMKTNRQPELT